MLNVKVYEKSKPARFFLAFRGNIVISSPITLTTIKKKNIEDEKIKEY